MTYLAAFALTLLVEVPIYVFALTAGGRVRLPHAATVAVLVNCVTHPVVWSFLQHYRAGGPAGYWTAFTLAELAAWLVEALMLRTALRLRGQLPYAASLTANTASVLAGMLLLTPGR